MKLLKWMKEEFLLVLPAVIYFAIAFNLIHFTLSLTVVPGEEYYSYMSATIGALIVGKMLIIVNYFPYINLFPRKPLIYNIVWKFLIYGFCTFIFRVLEGFFHLLIKFESFDVARRLYKVNLSSPEFWSTQMWVLLVFLVFVIFSEIIRVIGKEKIKKMIFG